MIHVISKSTFGSYDVRDIQCNANWCSCPYSDYALIPDGLVEGILATQGYCDIVLNGDGTEVVSFTAREIPTVPEECCGDVMYGIESKDHPGCYYRTVGGVVEWLNPPLVPGVEYRTTERHNGKPVYAYYANLGALPASGQASFEIGSGSTAIATLASFEAFAYGESNRRYKFPFQSATNGETYAIARTSGNRTVLVHVFHDVSAYTLHVTSKYTKQ